MTEPTAAELIIRKEKPARLSHSGGDKQVIWIEQGYLLKSCETLTEDYLRVRCRPRYKKSVTPCFQNNTILPDTGTSWRWAKFNGRFFYSYDNIPNKAPSYYQTQIPTRLELLEIATEIISDEEPQQSLTAFFNPYLNEHFINYLHFYGDCTDRQQKHLAKAAACIQGCIDHIVQNKYDIRKKTFFMEAAEWFSHNDVKYIPKNFRCLKTKITDVMNGCRIDEVIKLPRDGNDNRRIYTDEEIESWIYQMRGMGQNYTNAHIIRKVQYACELTSKPVPSDRWIGKVMEKHNTNYLTALGRYGQEGRLAVFYKGYVPLQNALFAGDCWQLDGTRVNIIDHKYTGINENGEKVKTQKYLYMIMVRDVHSGDILGYSLSHVENRWNYLNAIKMAVEESGYLPYQMVFDRFPGHNTAEFENFVADLKCRGVKVDYTSKSTGKAQLERWFDTFQTVFQQDSNYYYGQGIKSRRKFAHRSEEYLKEIRKIASKEGWNYDAACNETERLIEAYRNTRLCEYSRKHKMVQKSPAELHQDSDKPHVIIIEPHQYHYLFGLKKELQVKKQGLIETEIQKYPFCYRTEDYNIIRQYKKVLVCYHLEDLGSIHLYEISDKPVKKYLGVAHEVDAPQIYGPKPEFDKLQKQQAIIKEMDLLREQEYRQKIAAGSDIVTLLTPRSVHKYDYENAETTALNLNLDINKPVNNRNDYDITSQL